jgi:N-acetyl-beta-hexosaminidase
MFGLTIPIQFYIYAALSLAAIGGIGYGKYESAKYDAYVAKAETAAKEQEMINHYKAKEAAQVNEKVKNDYQNKLSIIKSTYGGMRLSSTNQTGTISNTTSPTDGTPADPKFIEKCAITTQQLVSLQSWLNEQIGIFNAK